MSYIYLASPYSHPDPKIKIERYERVLALAARLTQCGHIVFAPIVHSHPMAEKHGLHGNWDFWKRIDSVFIQQCKAMWIYTIDGWQESVGVNAEIEIARSFNKPLWTVDDNLKVEALWLKKIGENNG